MGAPGRIALVVAAVATGLAFAAVAPVGAAFVQVDVPTDSTAMDARLGADGDAAWTITYRVELDTEERRTAFEELEADVDANESAYLDRFRDRMESTVTNAESTTGRAMAVENLSVSTSRTGVPESYGLLTYRFRWTNFARVDGDRLEAGDALAGLFLDDGTSLTVRWPGDFQGASVTPSATTTGNRSVTWRGPRDFGPGEPRVVVEPAGQGIPFLPLVAGLAIALAAIGGAFVWRHGRATREGSEAPEPSDVVADQADAGAATETPPEELLSNEERVLNLLEEEGGRIKQQQIAERLEWTDAKTSQVVGDLRDADEVETFRIGRENVVTLPNHEL